MTPDRTDNSRNFVTEIFKELVIKIDASIIIECDYEFVGLITFANGKKTFFRSDRFNINPPGSIEISTDKNYSHFFLKIFGFKTPVGKSIFCSGINNNLKDKRDIDDGYNFAKDLGFPVIIKPNNSSKGYMVSKIFNKADYYTVARRILKKTNVMVIEKFYVGNDYRIVVFDGKVFAAYQREPLFVVGDGASTISILLKKIQAQYKTKGISTIKLNDYRIKANLKRLKCTYNTILPDKKKIQLLDNANVSTGGRLIDLTKEVHPDYAKLAITVARSMELKLCGIDIITADICSAIADYVILEINSAPALSHYASLGANQLKRTKSLYFRILKVMEQS